MLGHFMEKELNAVLKTNKSRKSEGLKIPPEVRKTRKFDDTLFLIMQNKNKQNNREMDERLYVFIFQITKSYRGITLTAITTNIL